MVPGSQDREGRKKRVPHTHHRRKGYLKEYLSSAQSRGRGAIQAMRNRPNGGNEKK